MAGFSKTDLGNGRKRFTQDKNDDRNLGQRLLDAWRFRSQQHEQDRQDAIWQKTTWAKMQGMFGIASDGKVRLGSEDTFKHFRGISRDEMAGNRFTRPITVTDIETGANDQPISISALKGVIDKRTGEFRVLDTYERYYVPKDTATASFNMSREVHKLTKNKIEQLRMKQQASYGATYNQQEATDLMRFFHGSLVVGHNVEEFDFSRLGIASRLQDEDILDTLVWAENAGVPRGKRNLEKMFKHYTGRSLKAAGYSHHFGFHDVLSTAELLSAIYRQKGRAGRDVRFVANKTGYSYGAYEPAMGTAIIKGGYYRGRGPRGLEYYMHEDEFDDRGVFEYEYDDNGNRVLPEGYGETWEDIIDAEEGFGASFAHIFSAEAGKTFQALQEELQKVRESTIGYKVAQQHALSRYLAGKDIATSRKYLKGLGYNKETINAIIKQSEPLRIARERQAASKRAAALSSKKDAAESMIAHMYRKGEISEKDYQWLSDVNRDADSGFSPRDVVYRARELRDEEKDRQKRVDERKEEEFKKIRALDRAEKRGQITPDQRMHLEGLIGSYEDLSDAMDIIIEKNKQLIEIYSAIGNIKLYDINQYIKSAKTQFSGVTSSARGVIPSFVLNPISRMGDAAFNAIDRTVAPWNAVTRTWNSGIGTAITGALGAAFGPAGLAGGMALTGGVNAVTQIAGNYQQAKMERVMLGMQNNFNTLGALTSWIATPFQMLHKATKLLTGAFGGLTIKLKNLMLEGISGMSQMGNPLEQLTGVNYTNYLGTTLMDMASLLGKGSTNTAIESFAKMQRDLFRFGKVDTNKLLAASMLGVFNDAFVPTTDAEGAYYGMANKILHSMQGATPEQQADIMYYVTQLNDTLAQTIRSAYMLGVSDVRDLTNPDAFHDMYWRPITSEEESNFRKTQFEYGVSSQQFGFSKMRFADRLWDVIGRDLYNGLNKLVDRAAEGDWKGVLETASDMWGKFKEEVSGVWESLGGGELTGKIKEKISGIWDAVLPALWQGARMIIDVWNQIFGMILEKANGLLSFLSTVHLDVSLTKKGLQFGISTVRDVEGLNSNLTLGDNIQGTDKGYATLALAEQLFPAELRPKGLYNLKSLTEADVMKRWSEWDTYGLMAAHPEYVTNEKGEQVLVPKSINLPQYHLQHLEKMDPKYRAEIMKYLAGFDEYANAGANTESYARAFLWSSGIPKEFWTEDILKGGLAEGFNAFKEDYFNPLMNTIATGLFGVDKAEQMNQTKSFEFNVNYDDRNKTTISYTPGKGVTVTGVPLGQQVAGNNGFIMATNESR